MPKHFYQQGYYSTPAGYGYGGANYNAGNHYRNYAAYGGYGNYGYYGLPQYGNYAVNAFSGRSGNVIAQGENTQFAYANPYQYAAGDKGFAAFFSRITHQLLGFFKWFSFQAAPTPYAAALTNPAATAATPVSYGALLQSNNIPSNSLVYASVPISPANGFAPPPAPAKAADPSLSASL